MMHERNGNYGNWLWNIGSGYSRGDSGGMGNPQKKTENERTDLSHLSVEMWDERKGGKILCMIKADKRR